MARYRKMILATAIVLFALTAGTFVFMQQSVFGRDPKGNRLEKVQSSPNYRDGAFQNEHLTPVMLEGASYTKMMWAFMNKPDHTEPAFPIPSVSTNLKTLSDEQPVIVWFGHSSYLIKYKGFTILVDPVFSGHASPVSFMTKAFKGSDVYKAADMPDIDICIITHDHYDHLDYETITQMHPRIKQFCTALGVGDHLENWGVPASKITELDWWETQSYTDSISITAAPARHFSGRGFTRGKTLWASYIINLKGLKIYAGGDSGYDTHFKRIGEQYGPFDIAMVECGQYGDNWPLIHMTPEETAMAASELNTKVLLPVHWAKFGLSLHPWKEPIERLLKASVDKEYNITTPLIGEPVILGDALPSQKWWIESNSVEVAGVQSATK